MFKFHADALEAYFGESRSAVGVIDPKTLAVVFANREFAKFMANLYLALGENPIMTWHKANAALRDSCQRSQMTAFSDEATGVRLEFFPFELECDGQLPATAVLCNVFAEPQQQENRYQEMLDHAPHHAWACSLTGEVFWINRTSQLFRHGQEHHDLSNSEYVNKIHPDDVQRTATRFSTGMVEGHVAPFRYRLLDSQGQSAWFLLTAAPVKTLPNGQTKFWVGASVNIDAFVQEEDRLKQRIGQLEAQTEHLQAQLAHAHQLLGQVQKMDLLTHLAGGVAHDLNNMLFVMTMHLGLLARKGLNDAQQGHVTALGDGVRNASRLAMQLSGFSGRLPQNAMPLNLAEVLQQAEPLFRQAVGAEAELVMALAADVGTVVADRVYLENAVINLLINARDAMEGRGRIELTLAAEPATSEAVPAQVVVAVKDHGIGMDEALRARIFEPLFTTKAPERGTGLGLAMVKNFVESSGGTIAVHSVRHEGSTFALRFPCSPLTPEPPQTVQDQARVGQGAVMLIEDNIAVRTAVAMTLRELGYTLITAAHIDQAIVLMDAGAKPDVIVSDIRMPGRLGVQDLLRHVATHRPVPVVFITGYSADVAIEEGLIEGTHPVLFKPFTSAELSRKLHEVMHGGEPCVDVAAAPPLR